MTEGLEIFQRSSMAHNIGSSKITSYVLKRMNYFATSMKQVKVSLSTQEVFMIFLFTGVSAQ